MPAVMIEELKQDVHFTLRMLRANRAFTAIAILTFAIGVGATTAIFSVANATLLRPLRFRQPEQLMSLFLRMRVQLGSGEIDMVWSYPKYQTLLRSQQAFGELSPHVDEDRATGGDRTVSYSSPARGCAAFACGTAFGCARD